MRIELTVDGPRGPQDVAIVAPSPVPLADVAPELADVVGVDSTATLWSDARPLSAQTRLGERGLRSGSLLTVGAPNHRSFRPGVLSLHIIGGPEAGRVVALARGRLTIGRDDDCDVQLADDRVSRAHAALDVGATALRLHDLGSTNGVSVDGVAIRPEGGDVRPGQVIRIGDSLLCVCGPDEPPAALVPAEEAVLVNRAPRHTAAVLERTIAVPQRAEPARPRRVQWVTALLPAIAGGAIAWVTHTPQFLLFALLSPVMIVSSSLGDRVHWRRSRRREAASYRRRRAEADVEVARALATETAVRRTNAPDPAALWRLAIAPSNRLWERRDTDPDHLHVRIGSADLASTLRVGVGSALAPAGSVHAVPLCVDLRAGPLGLAGPREVVAGLARWLLAQLAALQSPADVEFALLLSDERAPHWAWARWLPHLNSRVAAGPAECPALIADLAARADHRRAARRLDPNGWVGRWIVVVVDHAARLTDVGGLAALLAAGADVGLSAICVDVDADALPASCSAIAEVQGESGTRVSLRRGTGRESVDAVIDRVTPQWAEGVARALAPLVDASASDSSAIPTECGLLDVLDLADLDPDRLGRRWAASTGRADTVLGRSADGPLRIDLVADGPHALVAGTTGAGKSQLLQSLVAGLAVTHPPGLITFLLVDYKGGAAFAECARLPHTAGLVTDLDPHLTRRALDSLRAELRRRERCFATVGAADLDAYRDRPGRESVPRLIIVVDEFAALADELPDFVHGLVVVAQRGRSLGVHLVLATQRPGRAVSGEIRANTTLRIALRVTDPAESTDVIDAPDASTIERAQPGRAYLRTGTTLTGFQTARTTGSGAAAARPAVEPLGQWRRRSPPPEQLAGDDDLARLVEAVGVAAQRTGRSAARSPWIAPLPVALALDDLSPACATAVPLGRLDLPAEQAQPELTVDLTTGATLLITGAPGSGRTHALTTLALGAATATTPEELEIYVIDPVGTLAATLRGLPHTATALGTDDGDLVAVLLRRLADTLARRTVSRSDADRNHCTHLLVVDGWDAFLAGQDDAQAAYCTDLLTGLLRAGAGAGLTIAVAGGRPLLSPRFAGGFDARLLLRFADRTDYGMVGIPPAAVPTSMPPGRGIRAADAAEFQLAHAGAARADVHRVVSRIAHRWAGAAPSSGAVRIRSLPAQVHLADLAPNPARLSIGVAGDDAVPCAIDLFTGARRFLVAGPPRSGRSTTLQVLLVEARRLGIRTTVAATVRSPLTTCAHEHDVRVIDPADSADTVGAPPAARSLLLVDDSEAFLDTPAGDQLASWLKSTQVPLAAAVTGRCDDLATTYRGIAAEVRRSHCGLLLRPGPVDGELLGVRLGRRPALGPPGRGLLIGEAGWGELFDDGQPVPVQVARP